MTTLLSFQSIRGRLNALGLLVVTGFLLAGGIGILATNATHTALQRAYENRLVPLRLLKVLSESYSSTIPSAIARMNNGEWTTSEGYGSILEARDSIQRCWRLYQALPLSPEETTVLHELQSDLSAADQEIEGLMHMLEIFQSQGRGLLSNQLSMVLNSMDPTVRPLSEKIDELTRIQMNLAGQEFRASESRFFFIVGLLIAIIILLLAILFWAGMKLQKHIMTQLHQTLPALEQIGRGDLRVHIDSQVHDEFADIAEGINQMAHSLRVLVGRMTHSSAHLGECSTEFTKLSANISNSSRANATNSSLTSIATADASTGLAEISKNLTSLGSGVESLVAGMEKVRQGVIFADRFCDEGVQCATNAKKESQNVERVVQQVFRHAADLGAILQLYLQASPGQELMRTRMEECLQALQVALQGLQRLNVMQGSLEENTSKVAQSIHGIHQLFDDSYQLLQTLHISTHGAARDMQESAKALIRIAKTADQSRESALDSAKEITLIHGKAGELKSLSEDLGKLARKFRVAD